MNNKIGMIVYPVIYGLDGLQQIQLIGKGIFFTNQAEGYEYQEKMNETDKKHIWTNYLIPYDVND